MLSTDPGVVECIFETLETNGFIARGVSVLK